MAATTEWHVGVDSLAEEWDELADRTGADPFRRPGWIGAWHHSFGRGTLEVLAARNEGRLAAVLPIERRGTALSSPTNWHTPLFGAAFESADLLPTVASALFSGRPRSVSLSFLDIADPLHEEVGREARSRGYRMLERTLQRSPYLDLAEGWDDRWQSLGSKRRNTLNRRRRRLDERGEVELRIVEGGEELGELLEEALRVEALGWKGERGTAIIADPKTHGFYRRVAGWAAGRGILSLGLLIVSGRVVAFDLALEEDAHYLLKTGFDPDYRDCAPGLVLRAMMIERAYSIGLERYEFLGGPNPYKLEWSDGLHDRVRLQAFRPSPAGLATWLAYRHARPVGKRALARLRR
jgi:CelD/BcsL family acetyltransferase involved in cellulose biosynthesis